MARILCPQCDAPHEVNAALFTQGRQVRCARCRTSWQQAALPQTDSEEEAFAPKAGPARQEGSWQDSAWQEGARQDSSWQDGSAPRTPPAPSSVKLPGFNERPPLVGHRRAADPPPPWPVSPKGSYDSAQKSPTSPVAFSRNEHREAAQQAPAGAGSGAKKPETGVLPAPNTPGAGAILALPHAPGEQNDQARMNTPLGTIAPSAQDQDPPDLSATRRDLMREAGQSGNFSAATPADQAAMIGAANSKTPDYMPGMQGISPNAVAQIDAETLRYEGREAANAPQNTQEAEETSGIDTAFAAKTAPGETPLDPAAEQAAPAELSAPRPARKAMPRKPKKRDWRDDFAQTLSERLPKHAPAYGLAMALACVMLSGVFVFRAQWMPMAGIAMDTSTPSLLQVSRIEGRIVDQNGQEALEVTGEILNSSRKKTSVPILRLAVVDGNGRELYVWTAQASERDIPPGGQISFRRLLANPPAEGYSVTVRFIEKDDIVGAISQRRERK